MPEKVRIYVPSCLPPIRRNDIERRSEACALASSATRRCGTAKCKRYGIARGIYELWRSNVERTVPPARDQATMTFVVVDGGRAQGTYRSSVRPELAFENVGKYPITSRPVAATLIRVSSCCKGRGR